MNDKIRELLIEARSNTTEGKFKPPIDVWAEEFAHLIIAECVGVLENSLGMNNSTIQNINCIKQHFGIE